METLKNSTEFDRVRKFGRTWATALLVLNAAANGTGRIRCVFIAGKKTGKAVQRNRARRLLREAVRHRLPFIKPGHDLVWIARAATAESNVHDVGRAVEETLQRAKLWVIPPDETPTEQSRIIEVERDAPLTVADAMNEKSRPGELERE